MTKYAFLVVASLLGFSSVSMAGDCPDFSGSFRQTIDPETYEMLEFVQTGCESLHVHNAFYNADEGTQEFEDDWLLDGVPAPSPAFPRMLLSHRWEDQLLVTEVTSAAPGPSIRIVTISELTPEGDIINTITRYDADGAVLDNQIDLFLRQKP